MHFKSFNSWHVEFKLIALFKKARIELLSLSVFIIIKTESTVIQTPSFFGRGGPRHSNSGLRLRARVLAPDVKHEDGSNEN